MLVADADGERNRHDAARDRGPEGIQELLVVGEENDHLVAALSALRLQVMQDPERARMHLAEAHPALRIFALDVRHGAIDAAIALEDVRKRRVLHRILYRHQKIGARPQIDLRLELDGIVVQQPSAESAAPCD